MANDNIEIATEQNWTELGEPPYIYSPYPDQLIQVKEAGTRGAKDIVELVNEHWPVSIKELTQTSQEELDDGYSGSHIRNVLRSHYVPQDILDESNIPTEPNNSDEDSDGDNVVNDTYDVEMSPAGSEVMPPEDEVWHKVFRMGIRTALENDIDRESAFTSFQSGFIEGQKLKGEMEREAPSPGQ